MVMLLKNQEGTMVFNLGSTIALNLSDGWDTRYSDELLRSEDVMHYYIELVTSVETYTLAEYIIESDRDNVFEYLCNAIEKRKGFINISDIEDIVIGSNTV